MNVRVEEIELFALRISLDDYKSLHLYLCNILFHSLRWLDPSLNGDDEVFENHNVLRKTTNKLISTQ